MGEKKKKEDRENKHRHCGAEGMDSRRQRTTQNKAVEDAARRNREHIDIETMDRWVVVIHTEPVCAQRSTKWRSLFTVQAEDNKKTFKGNVLSSEMIKSIFINKKSGMNGWKLSVNLQTGAELHGAQWWLCD